MNSTYTVFPTLNQSCLCRIQTDATIVCVLLLATVLPTRAANDSPIVTPTNIIYQGNQSAGIRTSPPPNVVEVINLTTAIAPTTGVAGISFQTDGGGNLFINSGSAFTSVVINVNNALGIFAESRGSPSTESTNPFLGVPVPGSPAAAGGIVQINTFSDITTTGDNAHGIVASSRTTGYPQSVITALQNFTGTGIGFWVNSVSNGAVGVPLSGTIIDTNGTPIASNGGTFTLNANGTYSFNLGTNFNDLAVGEVRFTAVDYQLQGTNATGVVDVSDGRLIITVTNNGTNLVTNMESYSQYGVNTNSALPNLSTYIAGLLSDASAGGIGNSVTVSNSGIIATHGTNSHGIFAQSIGGNGGRGRDGSISHGSGAGGDGKMGGAVSVMANGTITTVGYKSAGVLALSQAGNGGAGGDGGTWRYGARGGTGGTGGDVEVSGNGTIVTLGQYGSGIIALSAGGDGGGGGSGSGATGGGNGGYGGRGGTVLVDGDWNITTLGDYAHGIWAKSVGGNAGSGGSGGWLAGSPGGGGIATDGSNVTIRSGGLIQTFGHDSYGIYAESVGGFGGQGGGQSGIFYSHGGDGNSGGSGGSINVIQTSTGSIITHNTNSHGIFAQSIGGGGGSGGGAGAIAGLGGVGGAGGFGGNVNVENSGQIQTFGVFSRGIYAQSIGGGGGDGGNGAGIAGIGGSGSGTSPGRAVGVFNQGIIITTNLYSDAIFAQSVGGGGGSAGSSAGLVAIGGAGNAGGAGGYVTVTNVGQLLTLGPSARGIVAQSIGGGGGDGGDSGALVAIGGKGSATSSGGVVCVVNTGTINSRGQAILAQSIGGGGGNGGSSGGWFSFGGSGGGGGDGDFVAVSNRGNLATFDNNASAIFAQSVGGGGGNGGNSVAVGAFASLAIGGSATVGGDGGVVAVNSMTGTIVTVGNSAHGIMAQSVGGGGGNGGFAFSGSIGKGFSAAVGIGGQGGGGGAASNVFVESSSAITTLGTNAHAIFAQSVGGGGGAGGFSIAVTGSDGPSLGISIGGKGGSGGGGGAVSLNSMGELQTFGDHSYGILAQSVGGGGGDGGFSLAAAVAVGGFAAPLSFGGAGNVGGNAGTANVNSGSKITTHGNDSHGIMVQSVGGGGGAGGFSVAGAISTSGELGLSFGGSGNSGGRGSNVTLHTTGDITTYGDRAFGILAQSVGGGGGAGGFGIAGGASGGVAANLSLGGFGKGGGDAGTVTLNSASSVQTFGANAHAIFVQSVGGGGGAGGFSVAGSLAISSGDSSSLAVGLSSGGLGGGGGVAGAVDVLSTGATITTAGGHSFGILAQSVGGGGGDGGFSVAGSLSLAPGSNKTSAAISASVGGFGGEAGDAGTVRVVNRSSIITLGTNAHGIFAQSVGGSGGDGGFSVAGSISLAPGSNSSSVGINASVGGFGGGGGNGNMVSVINTGTLIYTAGGSSDGIFAQSVGGGGGDGGFSAAGGLGQKVAVNVSVGGFGDAGGNGAAVVVQNTGTIRTDGDSSHGIMVQSVGGGGGKGGFSAAGELSRGNESKQISVAVGGFGAGGGDAGNVTVTNSGTITTFGDWSHGIFAQSVGGGGGDGGNAKVFNRMFSGSSSNQPSPPSITNTTTDTGGTKGWSLSVAVGAGGGAGSGGNGAQVNVHNSGVILTDGANARGIFAQSVGGGGGTGGSSSTDTGTSGSTNVAINIGLSLGGKGGDGGDGDTVTVVNSGTIVTHGAAAHGIMAQSVGGGGGAGGTSATTVGTPGSNTSKFVSLALALGGDGGVAGNGGRVSVDNSGIIQTTGEGAHAVFAQSVGGGGGDGGSATATIKAPDTNSPLNLLTFPSSVATHGPTLMFTSLVATNGGGTDTNKTDDADTKWNLTISVGAGGQGGSAGNGGEVRVNNTGTISTAGANARGIFAQSVGGGGGIGGASTSDSNGDNNSDVAINLGLSLGGKGGTGGFGNTVIVTNSGSIFTAGTAAHGIFAQSVGGGGGAGGAANTTEAAPDTNTTKAVTVALSLGGNGGVAGDGSNVVVVNTGRIQTAGEGANGIFAQSVGGGGGDGGTATATIKVTESKPEETNTAMVAMSFISVTATNGGGNGTNDTEKSSWGVSISVGAGGEGGAAGRGGKVSVLNVGDIFTAGANARGIFAQSVGGGGGVGGASTSDNGGSSGDTSVNIGFSLGGLGGAGGAADTVIVSNTGTIVTLGAAAHAIMAQSVGGGGGLGGASVTRKAGASEDSKSVILNAAVGGAGGVAGSGAAVVVANNGLIDTTGAGAYGILAQSVGGGGGHGGTATVETQKDTNKTATAQVRAFAFSSLADTNSSGGDTNSSSKGWSVDISLGLGGAGGAAGNGGAVTVSSVGSITTRGTNALGIFAQSVGGGGGAGGASVMDNSDAGGNTNRAITLSVGIGGQGAGGGNGNAVAVNNNGLITTVGDSSSAIFAQSIGGGGGVGGLSTTTPGGSSNVTFQLGVNVGGSGGTAGVGGTVTVTNAGGIVTHGAESHGIFAQSVGGGGGDAGGTSSPISGSGKVDLEVGVGGGGGNGNNGGAVTVVNTGNIDTFGNNALGILAQSIGGGGGRGGNAMIETNRGGSHKWALNVSVGGSGAGASDGGSVTVANIGNIVTRGVDSHGIFAQSVGGGGGEGGYGAHGAADLSSTNISADIQVAVGGSGGSSGNGGRVSVSNTGTIATLGDGSFGVFAQSVGGGGGVGGNGQSGSFAKLGIGGSAGAGGNGGDVDVTVTGTIMTFGIAAHGIFAQSVGGGGGIAGNANAGVNKYGVALNFGNSGGAGGNGGDITIVSAGNIITYGDGADGIFAQSVAGGGGLVGDLGNGKSFAGSVGSTGTAGKVTITHTGNITTYGNGANGIFAQSAAGTNSSAPVEINYTGSIAVFGSNSCAILVQSRGDQSSGNMTLTVRSGAFQGGRGSAGIQFADGGNNTLNNFNDVTTVDGLTGTAILGGTGNETINNSGTITGNVDLGAGTNSFNNLDGGWLNTGPKFNLGPNCRMLNAGTIAPGGKGTIQTTIFSGDLLDIDNSQLETKLGSASVYDRLEISGSATLTGKLSVVRYHEFLPKKGNAFTVLTAEQGVTNEFSEVADPLKGVYALQLGVTYLPTSVLVTTLQDTFLQFAGTLNQRAVAGNLDSVSEDAREAALIELLNTIPGTSLPAFFDLIAPEELTAMFQTAFAGLDAHGSRLLNRINDLRAGSHGLSASRFTMLDVTGPGNAPVSVAHTGTRPEQLDYDICCPAPDNPWGLFVEGVGEFIDVDHDHNAQGYHLRSTAISLGVDRRLGESLVAGLTFAYAADRADLTGSGHVDVDSYEAGLYGVWLVDRLHIAGLIGGSYHGYDTKREALGGAAKGDTDGWGFHALLDAGYGWQRGPWDLDLRATLQYQSLTLDDFKETGSLAPLRYGQQSEEALHSDLGLTLGYRLDTGNVKWRPALCMAWRHQYLDDALAIGARFASGAGAGFTVEGPSLGRDSCVIGAGVTTQWSPQWNTYLRYQTELGRDNYQPHSISAGVNVQF